MDVVSTGFVYIAVTQKGLICIFLGFSQSKLQNSALYLDKYSLTGILKVKMKHFVHVDELKGFVSECYEIM
jgi:hypothetical protein